jgi:hypothetical protein
MRATTAAATAVLAAGGAAIVARYRADAARARARLARLDRRRILNLSGPLEYSEWGEGVPLLLVHGVVGGCDCPPSWRALVPEGYRIVTPSNVVYRRLRERGYEVFAVNPNRTRSRATAPMTTWARSRAAWTRS